MKEDIREGIEEKKIKKNWVPEHWTKAHRFYLFINASAIYT